MARKKKETPFEASLRLGGDEFEKPTEEAFAPSYRVIADSKIPVSKHLGCLWEGRIKSACTARGDIATAWGEAVRYYENDQMQHRTGREGASGNNRFTRNFGDSWSETENVVFSNTVTMLPMLYAKNPVVECTTRIGEAGEARAKCIEAVLNELFRLKEAPGINIKTKARRGVLMALLTNNSYLKVGWTTKQESSDNAIQDLQKLTAELQNAKGQKQIIEIEGKLQALEETFSLLSPSGPTAKLVSPFRIYVDPTSNEPDHSDANWIAEEDFLPTAYIRAVYGKKNGEQWVSAFEPSHVLKAGADTESLQDTVNNFSLFETGEKEGTKYGYDSQRAFQSALHTKVWWIWDKTTRRVFLYADNNWKWPLWVWDDPLQLLRFYPYHRLWFHETPDGSQPKGEVTYYLDQQDAINDINSEIKRARNWSKNNIFYDKNSGLTPEDVTAVLKGDDGTARGVDVPEGKSLKDVIQSFIPPSLQHPELWNVEQRFQTINRITGISEAQRGAQFKTNTTNKAVDFYQKNTDIRIDEKIDAIEDWIGDFAYSLAQLVLRNMEAEQVAQLVGEHHAGAWVKIEDPEKFRSNFGIQIVGGSTDKPTSQIKKKQTLEMAQAVGQFANAIPALGILVIRAFARSFDEIVITDEDWQMIFKSMEQQQNKAGAGPNGGEGAMGAGAGAEGGAPPGAGEDQKAQLAQIIEQLPPEAKQQLQQLIEQGVPPSQALEQVAQQQQPTQ